MSDHPTDHPRIDSNVDSGVASTAVRYHGEGPGRIPIVDLSAARTQDAAAVDALARTLGEILLDTGFFYVEHHGVSDAIVRAVRDQTLAFFALPERDKLAIHIAQSPYHRGYFPEGEENALGNPVADLKEGFEMALELSLDDPAVVAGKPFHGPNAWPEGLPAFRAALSGMYDGMRQMCDEISGVLARSLGLPRDHFADKLDKPLCQMRVVRYPPQDYVPVDVTQPIGIGSGVHTDYGIVSIIWQMDGPGLEIQSPSGAWISCPVIPGTFVCQLGDASQILTNDHWKASRHRVVNATGTLRHALAYFHDPNYDCPLAPLPAFVTPAQPARYAPTTLGAHVARGFNGAYAYREWSKPA
jgi:isopenicillin N synthase-like dioxygenase